MRFLLLMAALSATISPSKGDDGKVKAERLDSVVVSATRAGSSTPVTYSSVNRSQIRKFNPVNSIPMSLALQPSVVSYSEGGTGLGNSAMTIRGSKGSQINVTLNGITLNDAESQEVFWVNIPSLSAVISSIQVQRGLGTSAAGSGAFGASINMNTEMTGSKPSSSVSFTAGSWNTFLTTVSASTGLSRSGFYLSTAFSQGSTDGYIRRGKVNSKSLLVSAGWLSGSNSLKFNYLLGHQKSGITWDGIDLDTYATDRRANYSGYYTDDLGNARYYDNQTDNYVQQHFQLNYTKKFSDALKWSTTLNYTDGYGYDEYYGAGSIFTHFGYPAAVTGIDGLDHTDSDMIYRMVMSNGYYVAASEVEYRSGDLLLTGGANYSRYNGDHYGKLLWVKVLGDGYFPASDGHGSWYSNVAAKNDFSAHIRGEYRFARIFTAYADLQYRHISYSMDGRDEDWYDSSLALEFDRKWDFFNPRAGISARFNDAHKAYASIALGNREPGRGDIKENVKGAPSPIKPEKMTDLEVGYTFENKVFTGSATLYAMEYRDILLETGRLSTSGYAIKENVPRGSRRGIELAVAYKPSGIVRLDGNLTLSSNKIKDYVSYVSVTGSAPGETKAVSYGDTDMLLSPSVTGMAMATLTPLVNCSNGWAKTLELSANVKHVGRQFIDNTMRDEMLIPAYTVAGLSAGCSFPVGGGRLALNGYVNNLLGSLYYAYGYKWWDTYDAVTGEYSCGTGIYPQPPVNFSLRAVLSF